MKKRKLKLESLQVDSFMTRLSDKEQIELNGGTTKGCVAAATPTTPAAAVGTIISTIGTLVGSVVITTIKQNQDYTQNTNGGTTKTMANVSQCPASQFQTKFGHISCAGGQAC